MTALTFLEFKLETRLFELSRNGELVHASPRLIDLLICLIENRDRIVSKEFLRNSIWQTRALSPAAVPTAIMELRRLLRDDPSSPRAIQSIRGRGYRFIAEISSPVPSDQMGNRREIPFVGREREFSALKQAAKTVNRDKVGRLIAIAGEAGAGKTRLTEEALSALEDEFVIAVAPTPPRIAAGPMWSWKRVLEQLAPASAAGGISSKQFSTNAQGATENGCGLIDKEHPEDTTCEPWISAILRSLSTAPTLIVIEDLHECDIQTIEVLERLVSEISFRPILLIATIRPYATEDAHHASIAGILNARRTTRIDLGPLSKEAIAMMTDPMTENREEVGAKIHERTSGNAYFAVQLVRHSNYASTQPSRTGDFGGRTNAATIVSQILSGLPRESRSALNAASIIGDHFNIKVLSRILNTKIETVLAQLEPAIAAGHISEKNTTHRFNHSILRDALYETIPNNYRKKLHFEIAQAHKQLQPQALDSVQTSHHLRNALPLGQTPEAISLTFAAGKSLFQNMAFNDAEAHFRAALLLLEKDDEQCQAQIMEITRWQAKSLFQAGKAETARSILIDLCMQAKRLATSEQFAECVLSALPDYEIIEVGTFDLTLIGLIEDAIRLVESRNSQIEARLFSALAHALKWAPDQSSRKDVTIRAEQKARKANDRTALASALAAKAELLCGPRHCLDRIAALEEAREGRPRNTDASTSLLDHTRMISALLESGRIHDVDAENRASWEIARRANQPRLAWYPETTDAMRSMMRGDFSIRERIRSLYLEIEKNGDIPENVQQGFATQEFFVISQLGRSSEIIGFARLAANRYPLVSAWRAAVAWLAWDSGDYESARDTLETFSPELVDALFNEANGGIGIALLAEPIAALGDRPLQEQLYSLISSVSNTSATAGYAALYFGCFERWAGVLAESLGGAGSGLSHFKRAIQLESDRDALLWRAYAQVDFARCEIASGLRSKKGREALNSAIEVSERLKLPRLHRVIESCSAEVVGRE